MAKAKKSLNKKDKIKNRKVRFYGVNITLQSTERSGANVYRDFIKRIYDDQMLIALKGEIRMIIRNQFSTTFQYKNESYEVLYGKILRFTVIKNWFDIKKQIFNDKVTIPADLVPNAFETDYIFIPEAHRFFIRYSNKINIHQTVSFFRKALRPLLIPDEILKVNFMKSQDAVDSIVEAYRIGHLEVNVSYTNDDINKEARALMDRMLKDAHSGETKVDFKPDATGSVDAKSPLVNGLLGVAKDNGSAVATTYDKNGRRIIINTSDYPEKINIEVPEVDGAKEDEKRILFNKIMDEYRNKEDE